jgi:hypothetical protein
MDEPEDRSRLMSVLDGAEAVATIIYVVMISIVAIAILVALAYIARNPPSSFGTQGEWFYVAIAFVLVISWVAGQAMWLIKRRRRPSSQGALQWPKANVEVTPSGFSLKIGTPPTIDNQAARNGAWTWNIQSKPIATTTLKLDNTQLAAARAARAERKSWEEIARQVNPDYGFLSEFEQDLYQRALQLAVDASA